MRSKIGIGELFNRQCQGTISRQSKNVFSTGMLQSKMMQISEIEPNRDLFPVRAKKVTIKA